MKRIILYLFLFLSSISFEQESVFEKGNDDYNHENYEEAIASYSSLIGQGLISTDLYYNLGNAYYRNGDIGKAIWAYESSLKIDPDNADTKTNLAFTNSQTKDRIDNYKPGLGSWLKGLLFVSNINFWAWLSIFISIGLALAIILFFSAKRRKRRNLSLFMGMAFSLLLIFSVLTAYFHKNAIIDRIEGVIIDSGVEIKMSPLETAKTSFELNEGTKVLLHETNEDWVLIEVNGNSGWVMKEDLWEI